MIGPLVAPHRPKSTKFKPRLGEGYLWGTVSAVGYGCSPLFIVYGLGVNATLVDGLAAGLVSYSAAVITVTIAVVVAGGITYIQTLDRTARNWFALSGAFVFVSQALRYMALAVAPVTIVVPIQRLSVVFRVIFSWMINRDHEVITAKVLASIGISVLGAFVLTLSMDIVLALFPTEWADALSVEWP